MVRRFASVAVILALVGACGPKGGSGSHTPAASGGARAPAFDGTFTYRPATLRTKAAVELTSTGGGVYLQATATIDTDLTIEAAGEGLLVRWDVGEVGGLAIDGTLPPPPTDPAVFLAEHGRGAWVVDARGLEDVRATDTHPDNASRRERLAAENDRLAEARAAGKPAQPDVSASLLAQLPGMLALPVLPMQPLSPGSTDERTTTTELELPQFDVVLPIETTRRITFVVLDESGATRLAELQIDEDRYGGLELDDGDIELEERSEGTLLFDVDRGSPYRFEQTTTTTFTAGDRGGDTMRIVRAEFEPTSAP